MKNHYKSINRQKLTLGDLVCIVESCSRTDKEAVAALMDLFQSGRVRVKEDGQYRRIRLLAA